MGVELPPGSTYDGVDLTKAEPRCHQYAQHLGLPDGVDAYLTIIGAKKACGGHWD